MEPTKDFATIALERGFVDNEQLLRALAEQKRLRAEEGLHLFLAEVFVRMQLLTFSALGSLLEAARGYREEPLTDRRNAKLGDLAVWKGYVTPLQLLFALQQQRDEDATGFPHRMVGEILVDRGWLAPWELEDLVVSLAELGYSSTRTGETPSEAIPLRPVKMRRSAIGISRPGHRQFPAHVSPAAPIRVSELMARPVTTTRKTSVGDVLASAREHATEFVVVLHHQELAGVVSIFDLHDVDPATPVGRCMASPVITVGAHASIHDAARILRDNGIGCAPVMGDGDVIGIVTRDDLRHAGVPRNALDTPFPERELGGSG
jgi:CBS domain-containing protein